MLLFIHDAMWHMTEYILKYKSETLEKFKNGNRFENWSRASKWSDLVQMVAVSIFPRNSQNI
jgi:hypothetical protein